MLKRKTKQTELVHIQTRNKNPFLLYVYLLKKQFHMKLILLHYTDQSVSHINAQDNPQPGYPPPVNRESAIFIKVLLTESALDKLVPAAEAVQYSRFNIFS
jgi:hypothetical protein